MTTPNPTCHFCQSSDVSTERTNAGLLVNCGSCGRVFDFSDLAGELPDSGIGFLSSLPRTFSGDNASLRRLIVGEPFSMVEKSGQRSGVTIESSTDVNQRVQNIGSILIDELCTRFGLTALTQQAVKIYQLCVSSQMVSFIENIEALACAAFMLTCEQSRNPSLPSAGVTSARFGASQYLMLSPIQVPSYRDVSEVARQWTGSSRAISPGEISKLVSLVSNVIEGNLPYVVEALMESMYSYFQKLGTDRETRDLSAHIANETVRQSLCVRRSSASLSAAAIYLACVLQSIQITQTEFCRLIGVTEVTLRKVYKELFAEWPNLVPKSYRPLTSPASTSRKRRGRNAKLVDAVSDAEGADKKSAPRDSKPAMPLSLAHQDAEFPFTVGGNMPPSDGAGSDGEAPPSPTASSLLLLARGPPPPTHSAADKPISGKRKASKTDTGKQTRAAKMPKASGSDKSELTHSDDSDGTTDDEDEEEENEPAAPHDAANGKVAPVEESDIGSAPASSSVVTGSSGAAAAAEQEPTSSLGERRGKNISIIGNNLGSALRSTANNDSVDEVPTPPIDFFGSTGDSAIAPAGATVAAMTDVPSSSALPRLISDPNVFGVRAFSTIFSRPSAGLGLGESLGVWPLASSRQASEKAFSSFMMSATTPQSNSFVDSLLRMNSLTIPQSEVNAAAASSTGASTSAATASSSVGSIPFTRESSLRADSMPSLQPEMETEEGIRTMAVLRQLYEYQLSLSGYISAFPGTFVSQQCNLIGDPVAVNAPAPDSKLARSVSNRFLCESTESGSEKDPKDRMASAPSQTWLGSRVPNSVLSTCSGYPMPKLVYGVAGQKSVLLSFPMSPNDPSLHLMPPHNPFVDNPPAL